MGSVAHLVVHVCQIHRQIAVPEDQVPHRSEGNLLVAQAHQDLPMSRLLAHLFLLGPTALHHLA